MKRNQSHVLKLSIKNPVSNVVLATWDRGVCIYFELDNRGASAGVELCVVRANRDANSYAAAITPHASRMSSRHRAYYCKVALQKPCTSHRATQIGLLAADVKAKSSRVRCVFSYFFFVRADLHVNTTVTYVAVYYPATVLSKQRTPTTARIPSARRKRRHDVVVKLREDRSRGAQTTIRNIFFGFTVSFIIYKDSTLRY